jgi:hypothetical protein
MSRIVGNHSRTMSLAALPHLRAHGLSAMDAMIEVTVASSLPDKSHPTIPSSKAGQGRIALGTHA